MAPLKVEVTSRELIKPSISTLPHLNTIQLSFLEQFAPPMYIPLLFFYQNDTLHNLIDNRERSLLLKTSLSDTLVRFYPLAGRVQGGGSIDCNDKGVEFYEANVSGNLLEVIENPNIEDLGGLLPFEPIGHDKNLVLSVQVNHFSCGGMAISVCISHKIADGTAAVDFVRAWASMARGVEGGDHVVMTHPKFDGASYFPPIAYNGVFMPESLIYKEKLVTRRFTFDKKMLDTLKGKAADTLDGSPVKAPTRVEVVSAFLWKCIMEASQRTASDVSMNSRALHAVNLRKRIIPSIPEDSFGNFWWVTITDSLTRQGSKQPELVKKLREAIRKVDDKCIKTLQNGNGCIKQMEKDIVGFAETCRFSSWSRFPLYEVNFGWGKPTKVCTTTLPFKNAVILLSTRCGEGIEAYVNMVEEDMAMVEHDLELLSPPSSMAKVAA